MARFKQDFTARFQTTLDEEIEETNFAAGDEVRVMARWQHHTLIKDGEGHYYNVPRDLLEE